MSVFCQISIFLRNFLIKQHPYFSCCAACGEITTPLGGRLCTSLQPAFPVDAVIISPSANKQALADTVDCLQQHAPWLRTLYTPVGGVREDPQTVHGIRPIPESALRKDPAASGMSVQALLHLYPDLAEHFIVFTDCRSVAAPLHPLDFFTPNGIPLLFLLPPSRTFQFDTAPEETDGESDLLPHPGVFACTRENAAAFLSLLTNEALENGIHSADPYAYLASLTRWTYAAGRGVPAGEAAMQFWRKSLPPLASEVSCQK